MKPLANLPVSKLFYTLVIFSLAFYAVIRTSNLSQAVQRVKTTADTPSYVRISKESILTDRFLASSRPFVFPLVLKLLGNHEERVVWAQGLFSIISWSVLAVAVAQSLHHLVLQFAGFWLILLLSLYRYIIGWDSVLLTESLSLSLMALFLAGWLWLVKRWRWEKAIFVLVVGFFWAFCRDTNAWVVFMIALLLLLLVVLRLIEKRYLFLSAAFILMFLLSDRSADFGQRWVFPFQNVVGRRILPDAPAVDFFVGCGMPVTPELVQLTGEFASGLDRAFYDDPALKEYRTWLHQTGKACYVKWLLADPLGSLRSSIVEFNSLMTLANVQPFLFSRRFSPILPGRIEALLYPRQQPWIAFLAACGIILAAVFAQAWTRNKAWPVAILLILLVFPHYFIVWHGDVMGIFRHVLTVSIQFYLGLWLMALLVLDRIFSFRKVQERRTSQLLVTSGKQ